tara:strand:+ start:510 stop:872 length:363 start_codon:yes stop_codon:yes gene_type:complete
MKTDLKSLMESANAVVKSCTVAEAREKVGNDEFVFIDVREKQEMEVDGHVPGSVLVPRGMLEFMLDKNSLYYNPIFDSPKTFIFYCKSGGRSVLAAHRAIQMGLQNVMNMQGGFTAWSAS